jgi:endonuclease/exonuclease/phosphatase family metal-dependent hydrolase
MASDIALRGAAARAQKLMTLHKSAIGGRSNIVPALTVVDHDTRRALLELPSSLAAHDKAMMSLPAFSQVAASTFPQPTKAIPSHLRIGAWNIQQGHFPEDSGRLLAAQSLDIALLTELDLGMRRTGQINLADGLAAAQRHGYVFGVEFLELLSPPGLPPHDADEGDNKAGFHGNGLTAARAPLQIARIDLAPEADWFINPRRNQRRIGGRMAVAASFALGNGECVVVSVHLESDTDRAGRARQMNALLTDIDKFAAGRPVLVGGDLNAGARTPGFDYAGEPLFEVAQAHGYDWRSCNAMRPTSRCSRVRNAVQQDQAHFDWFFVRGLIAEDPDVVPAVDDQGMALSDHEIITVTVRLPEDA